MTADIAGAGFSLAMSAPSASEADHVDGGTIAQLAFSATMEYIRTGLGFTDPHLDASSRLIVRELRTVFDAEVRPGETLSASVRASSRTRRSLTLATTIGRSPDPVVVARATVAIVVFDTLARTTIELPSRLLRAIEHADGSRVTWEGQ